MKIIYPYDKLNQSDFDNFWVDEAKMMEKHGFEVVSPLESKPNDIVLVRGSDTFVNSLYDIYDFRFINTQSARNGVKFLSSYYPVISDLTIETYFFDDLSDDAEHFLKSKNWDKAFIKKDFKSLFQFDDVSSIWPRSSLMSIKQKYEELNFKGKYCIRAYKDESFFYDEERYFVLNGSVFHRNQCVPYIVKEAVKRLSFLQNMCYSIDIAGDFIVEINPGESSDRYADNSLDLFCSWFADAFLKS